MNFFLTTEHTENTEHLNQVELCALRVLCGESEYYD